MATGLGRTLRESLARAAAAVNPRQAGATHELWEREGSALRAWLAEYSGDPLCTMYFPGPEGDPVGAEAGGSGDTRPVTLHPVPRFLLLRKLVVADGGHSGASWKEVEEAPATGEKRVFAGHRANR